MICSCGAGCETYWEYFRGKCLFFEALEMSASWTVEQLRQLPFPSGELVDEWRYWPGDCPMNYTRIMFNAMFFDGFYKKKQRNRAHERMLDAENIKRMTQLMKELQ